ncbi:small subunit processome component 20 [Salvia divinorum]|uniref:Small subunit processome component 20 n=1 Tax=Salvia divinorum TaxID=28513 RepID=A0ABD1G6U1_SALDI
MTQQRIRTRRGSKSWCYGPLALRKECHGGESVLDGQDVTVKRVLLIGSLKFYNIVHLQKHRRATALARFSNFVSSVYLFKAITYKVFVPLLFSMLFNARDGNDESIRSACVNALGSIWLHDVGPVQCLASQMFPIFVTKLDDQKP